MSDSSNWHGEVVFGFCYLLGVVATASFGLSLMYLTSDGIWGISKAFYPLLDFDPKAKSAGIDIAKDGLSWSVPLLMGSCLGLNSIEIIKRLKR